MMETKLLLYSVGIWFVFVISAILNGGFRNSVLKLRIGDYRGHVISTIILIAVVLAVTFVFLAKTDISYSRTDLLLMGTLWLVLTVVFEFGFGHYVMGNSWNALLADYNVLKGRVWVFVPLTSFIAPLLCGTLLAR